MWRRVSAVCRQYSVVAWVALVGNCDIQAVLVWGGDQVQWKTGAVQYNTGYVSKTCFGAAVEAARP